MHAYKFIYNPHSGRKRILLGRTAVTLDAVKELLEQYQIPVDYFPTKYPNHAKKLATEAVKEGYSTVLVAGGDGTIAEVANGLIGSKVVLGIIPLGSFMNIARMLSIAPDIEKAIQLIKIGRKRKVDVGKITKIDDKVPSHALYFMENVGIGLWARLHKFGPHIEKGQLWGILKTIQLFFNSSHQHVTVSVDGEILRTKALLVIVSNGPYSSVSLQLAPEAKLNDHLLTITIYKMTKFSLLYNFFDLLLFGRQSKRNVETYQGKRVRIETEKDRLLQVDGKKSGTTPVEMTIVPNALEVICGFSKFREESGLRERIYLEG